MTKYGNKIIAIHKLLVFSLIFLILIYPTLFVGAKLILLSYLLLSQYVYFSGNGGGRIRDFLFIICPSVVGAIYCFWGQLNDAPGAVSSIPVFILYPLLFGFLASSVDEVQLKWLDGCLTFIFSFAALYVLMYFLTLNTAFNKYIYVGDKATFGLYEGYTKLSFPLLALLNYSGTYLVCKLYLEKNFAKKILISFSFFLTVAAIIVTGRRATWVVLIFSCFAYLFLCYRDGVLLKKFFIGAMIFFILISFFVIYFDVDIVYLFQHLSDGFSFSSMDDGGSSFERGAQFKALMQGFYDSPLIGHGIGATARMYGSLRSVDQPWTYELVYVHLLFCLGIIGFCFYFSYVFYSFSRLMRFFHDEKFSEIAIPVFFSGIGFFVASATNPYLLKFDYMFVVFLPLFVLFAGESKKWKKISTSSL